MGVANVGGGGDDDGAGDGRSDGVTVPMQPRFTGPSLLAMIALVVLVFVQVGVVGGLVAEALGLFSPEARGGEGDRILANTATVWLATSALACLLVGSVLLVVEAQRPTPSVHAPTGTEEANAQAAALAGIFTGLGDSFAKLKGARAALFAGVVLLVTIANGSVPEVASNGTETTTTTVAAGE